MTFIRHLTLAAYFAFHASVAFCQVVPAADNWCQRTLWNPVSVPPPGSANVDATSLTPSPEDIVYSLSLSGGGYRAMLFHIGTLRRINDAKLLPKLKVISSVSGGSITAAVLAHRWERLLFDETGFATNLSDVVEKPLLDLANQTTGLPSVLFGFLPFTSAPEALARKLDAILFATNSQQRARLIDIGAVKVGGHNIQRPVFIFLATNLQTGELLQFRANVIGGPQVGWTTPGEIALADAVVASAGFPPFFAPLKMDLSKRGSEWAECRENNDNPFGLDPQNEPTRAIDKANQERIRSEIYLADGGIRDNLGVSAIEEINRVRRIRMKNFGPSMVNFKTVNLISDGGAATAIDVRPSSNWFGVFRRVTSLMSDQPNDLRVDNVIRSGSINTLVGTGFSDFVRNPCESPDKPAAARREEPLRTHLGSQFGDTYAYWSIRRLPKVHIGMDCPSPTTGQWMHVEVRALASVLTDLAKLEPSLQARLINWGYLSAHHGLPYISTLIPDSKSLESYVETCKLPFGHEVVDPKSDTPSAREATCLKFKVW